MHRFFSTLVALGASFLLVSGNAFCGEADDAVSRGEKFYVEFCQGCHGADKSGLTGFSGEREDLLRILEGDTDQMPDFYGIFSDEEVTEIYAYVTAPAD